MVYVLNKKGQPLVRMGSVIFCLIMLIHVGISSSINAATLPTQTITEEKEFTSADKEPIYKGFSTVISKGDKQYELTDISYKRIGTEKDSNTVSKTTTRTKTGLNGKYYSVGQTDTITENGKEYVAKIINVTYNESTEGNRWGEVSGNKDYGLQTDKPTPPNTMTLSYYDSGTGETLSIDAPLTELKQTSSQWQDYSYIDIEVSNYTDSKYMFEGNVINNDGRTVLPESYYSTLLRLAGMNDGKHRISSVYWMGGAYQNGSVKNRQARANIQAYSASYTAFYYKKFSLNNITTFDANIEYQYDAPVQGNQPLYRYTATATYSMISRETTAQIESPNHKAATGDESQREKPTQEEVVKTITTLSLLLVLCAGFVILIMFLLTKFKLRKKDFAKRK